MHGDFAAVYAYRYARRRQWAPGHDRRLKRAHTGRMLYKDCDLSTWFMIRGRVGFEPKVALNMYGRARAHTIDRLRAHSMTTNAVRVVMTSMDAAPPGRECVATGDARLVGDAPLVAGDDAGSEDVVFLRGS